jgi:hypothetical protein
MRESLSGSTAACPLADAGLPWTASSHVVPSGDPDSSALGIGRLPPRGDREVPRGSLYGSRLPFRNA